MPTRILILGASGQIGTDLVENLRQKHGAEQVVTADLHPPKQAEGPFVQLNVKDEQLLRQVVKEYGITEVYHLVAMLSATAEEKPVEGWQLNMDSLFHVLNMAREKMIDRVFWPSSIAAFGPNSPKDPCGQTTIMDPGTVYGISKLAGELWCDYYHRKYGVDVRSIRYPGLISYKAKPGGGTTDYAVDIFHQALESGHYTSFIAENTRLPMMYMPDAIRATVKLMEAPADQVLIRTSYNIAAISFTPKELAEAIRKEIPDFTIDYAPDTRDSIAQGWPAVMDDKEAREHWGHKHDFDLQDMVKDMLKQLSQ